MLMQAIVTKMDREKGRFVVRLIDAGVEISVGATEFLALWGVLPGEEITAILNGKSEFLVETALENNSYRIVRVFVDETELFQFKVVTPHD